MAAGPGQVVGEVTPSELWCCVAKGSLAEPSLGSGFVWTQEGVVSLYCDDISGKQASIHSVRIDSHKGIITACTWCKCARISPPAMTACTVSSS